MGQLEQEGVGMCKEGVGLCDEEEVVGIPDEAGVGMCEEEVVGMCAD